MAGDDEQTTATADDNRETSVNDYASDTQQAGNTVAPVKYVTSVVQLTHDVDVDHTATDEAYIHLSSVAFRIICTHTGYTISVMSKVEDSEVQIAQNVSPEEAIETLNTLINPMYSSLDQVYQQDPGGLLAFVGALSVGPFLLGAGMPLPALLAAGSCLAYAVITN